jgi:mitogen-activated protein kinase kinase
LPTDGYSEAARNFVHACLNKIPKLRPNYAALLKHPWLKPLVKPVTITEEDEEEEDTTPSSITVPSEAVETSPTVRSDAVDPEVAAWVVQAIEKRKQGKMAKSEKPALHAAPLDAVQAKDKATLNAAEAMDP